MKVIFVSPLSKKNFTIRDEESEDRTMAELHKALSDWTDCKVIFVPPNTLTIKLEDL